MIIYIHIENENYELLKVLSLDTDKYRFKLSDTGFKEKTIPKDTIKKFLLDNGIDSNFGILSENWITRDGITISYPQIIILF